MATNQIFAQGTLLDVMNTRAPDGSHLKTAQVLQKATPMLKEGTWKEANDVTRHVFSVQYSLGASTIAQFNKGTASNLGSEKTVACSLQRRENRPYVDTRLLDIAPDKAAYLADKATSVIMGIGQDVETDILYGSMENGDAYDGLANRLNALSHEMVLGNGGTGGNLTSLYLVAWGDAGAYLAYPKGSMAGVDFKDLGPRMKDMTDGTTMRVHEIEVAVTAGLCVEDERAHGRIANIDVATVSNTTFNEDNLIYLVNQMPAHLRATTVGYASRKLKSAIDMRANAKGNAYYDKRDVFGEEVRTVFGVPIRLSEMISEAEDQVA